MLCSSRTLALMSLYYTRVNSTITGPDNKQHKVEQAQPVHQ
jgi:hypothetical protein